MHLVVCLFYLYQWCTVKQISDNEIYLLIKYIKSVLWRVGKRLSYIEEARCLKVKRVRVLSCLHENLGRCCCCFLHSNVTQAEVAKRSDSHPDLSWTDFWMTSKLLRFRETSLRREVHTSQAEQPSYLCWHEWVSNCMAPLLKFCTLWCVYNVRLT